jgi:hypothetical protein
MAKGGLSISGETRVLVFRDLSTDYHEPAQSVPFAYKGIEIFIDLVNLKLE